MRYLTEPDYSHGKIGKTAVVLVNLGSPAAPTAPAVRRYLQQFLCDPRVVEIPRLLWWPILYGVILPLRARSSAKKYAKIWDAEGSPLVLHTEKQAKLLQGYLGERGHEVIVAHAMTYGAPAIPDVLRTLKNQSCERILILPAYPQYSATSTAASFDAINAHYARVRNLPELRFVKHYHDHPAYLDALKQSICAHWQRHGRGEHMLISFHGVPHKMLTLGDPYFCECHKTARLLAARLGLTTEQYTISFQSRLGRAKWLQPYTANTVQQLAQQGVKHLDVVCPGFIADCLETLEEIAIEVHELFKQAGGQTFAYIPCLNQDVPWLRGLAEIAEQHLIGWPTMLTPGIQDELKQQALQSRRQAQALQAKPGQA